MQAPITEAQLDSLRRFKNLPGAHDTEPLQHFRTPQGRVGFLAPVPQIDPLILQFKDGLRDVYRIRDLEVTSEPLTDTLGSRRKQTKNAVPLIRPIRRETIRRLFALYDYLKKQSKPITLREAKEELGFSCVPVMSRQREGDRLKTLEELGIVRRIPLTGRYLAWELTDEGRERGDVLILAQRPDYYEAKDDKPQPKNELKRTTPKPKKEKTIIPPIKKVTVDKLIRLYDYLAKQSKPVTLKEAEAAVGFKCVTLLSRQRDNARLRTLEELGLVKRIPLQRHYLAWQITDRGRDRKHAMKLIKAQLSNGTPPERRAPRKVYIKQVTDKLMRLLELLAEQTQAKTISELEELIDFDIRKKIQALYRLGLLDRILITSKFAAWQINDNGRAIGVQHLIDNYDKYRGTV